MMISGRLPFDGTSKAEVFGKIRGCRYPRLVTASDDFQDLISKMLVVSEDDRQSAAELLKHPFFVSHDNNHAMNVPIDNEIFSNLKRYRGQSHLRKAAMNMLIKMIQPTELSELRAEFEKIDTDMSGIIEIAELKAALKTKPQLDMSDKDLDKIIKELDYDDNGKINYTEFLSATIDISKYLTREKVMALFKQFDVNNDNTISKENIKAAFTKLGRELDDDEVNAIM